MKFTIVWYRQRSLFDNDSLRVTKIEKTVKFKNIQRAYKHALTCEVPPEFVLTGIKIDQL